MRAQDDHLRKLAKKRKLRLCDYCFKSNRNCQDGRWRLNLRGHQCWKKTLPHQWAPKHT